MDFNFLELARKAAFEAGKIIMAYYQGGFSVEQKADHSPVTEADKEADRIIRKVLSVSGIPVISEETVQVPYEERRKWKVFWVVDPLDGTKEFVKKTDEFCINIALVREGTPTDGLVFVPVKGLLYATDHGALCRETWTGDKAGRYDRLADRIDLNRGIYSDNLCTSVSHSNPITIEYIRRYGSSFPSGEIIRLGSAWKFGLMAEGKAGLYPRFSPTSEWDTAAGHALLRAAGGDIIDAETGRPLMYNKPDPVNPSFLAFLPPFDRETAMKFVP
jgi:3'(2'), 5'-bisphosphate nucleotidase